MQQIQARDQQALGTLYDRLAPLIHAVVVRILADRAEAEEVLVETFWQVWQHAGSFDASRGTLEGWIVTIARHRALDRLRARQRQAASTASYGAGDRELAASRPSMPEAAALQGERARAVAAALAGLPDDQRLAIELAYYRGLSRAEIAAHVGQPVGTVKTRIRLGLTRLRTILAPYLGEHP